MKGTCKRFVFPPVSHSSFSIQSMYFQSKLTSVRIDNRIVLILQALTD